MASASARGVNRPTVHEAADRLAALRRQGPRETAVHFATRFPPPRPGPPRRCRIRRDWLRIRLPAGASAAHHEPP